MGSAIFVLDIVRTFTFSGSISASDALKPQHKPQLLYPLLNVFCGNVKNH